MKSQLSNKHYIIKSDIKKESIGRPFNIAVMLILIGALLSLSGISGCSGYKPSGNKSAPVDTPAGNSSEISKRATEALVAYFHAIKTDNIEQQKILTADKALRFTLFKELEDDLGSNNKTKTTVATPDMSVITTSENKVMFKGSTIFTTIQLGNLSIATSVHRFADPVLTKNKQGKWKLSDFTRDGKKISETVYSINKVTQTKNFNVKVMDLLLLPKRSLVEIMVQNKSDDDIVTQIELSSLSILGPNDTVSKQMPVQTKDPIIKKFHYIKEDGKLTAFLGFGKVPIASRDLMFKLTLTSDDAIEVKVSLP